MTDRVDAGGGGDLARLGGGEVGVEDGDAGAGLDVEAGHLVVRLGIGDQRRRLGLTTGAGGGGDGDEGEHRLGRLVDAPVILHFPAVGQEEIDALGGVHRRAAPQANDEVDLEFGSDGEPAGDVLGGGVFADAVVEAVYDAGVVEGAPRASTCPASTMPGSVTRRARVAPSALAMEPSWLRPPG